MTRRAEGGAPECEHLPVLMALPGHPDYVAVQCLRCGASTGYGLDANEAWDHWRRGDVTLQGTFPIGRELD